MKLKNIAKTLKNMRKIDEHHHISPMLGHIFKDNEGIYEYYSTTQPYVT